MREKEVSDVWMLEETTTLDKLIIHESAQIHTPDGKFVAMTINGSGTPITPGTYYGDIVLTVADTCHMPPHGLMKMMNRSEEFICECAHQRRPCQRPLCRWYYDSKQRTII